MMAKQRTIMLIDMQSFYASVEKAKMPEYRNKPLAVAGDPARRSGIILAACPLAKAKGVSTAEPLWQSLQKCPELIIVRPHMQEYIEVSTQIMSIIEEFSDLVEPYSIDEMFIDAHFICLRMIQWTWQNRSKTKYLMLPASMPRLALGKIK